MLRTITLTGGIWIVLGTLFALYVGQVVKLVPRGAPKAPEGGAEDDAEPTINQDGEPPIIDYTRDGWEDY